MEGLKERALAEGIVGEEDWDKVVQHGCSQLVEGILRLLDMHKTSPEALPAQGDPELEETHWKDTVGREGDRLELEEVDRVQPGKTFMPSPEIPINIPRVLLPILNRILSDEDYRIPTPGRTETR